MTHRTPVPVAELPAGARADLEAARFTVDGVAAALGPLAGAALDRAQVLPADLATRDTDEPVAGLVRLFSLGRSVTPARLGAALPTLGVDGLERLGLVVAEDGRVRAAG